MKAELKLSAEKNTPKMQNYSRPIPTTARILNAKFLHERQRKSDLVWNPQIRPQATENSFLSLLD